MTLASNSQHTIVLAEDDPSVRAAVQRVLELEGYSVVAVNDGRAALDIIIAKPPHAAVLDVMMPFADGLTVCRELRHRGNRTPILLLTARHEVGDRVAGLDAGADDYLAKPFQIEELVARLRAIIRRAAGQATSELTAGGVRLDGRSGRVTLNGEPVKLTAQEFKLLSYLMHHKGKVVSRTELIEHIYDQDFDRDSNTIEVFITRIRKKLGADLIMTTRGLGYSLNDQL